MSVSNRPPGRGRRGSRPAALSCRPDPRTRRGAGARSGRRRRTAGARKGCGCRRARRRSSTLRLLQVGVESVQPVGPDLPSRLDPGHRFLQRRSFEPARPCLPDPATADQSGVLEHLQVLRDRLHAHPVWRRELADGRLTVGQLTDNPPPRRVGKRSEHDVEPRVVGSHHLAMKAHALANCGLTSIPTPFCHLRRTSARGSSTSTLPSSIVLSRPGRLRSP